GVGGGGRHRLRRGPAAGGEQPVSERRGDELFPGAVLRLDGRLRLLARFDLVERGRPRRRSRRRVARVAHRADAGVRGLHADPRRRPALALPPRPPLPPPAPPTPPPPPLHLPPP